MAIMYNEKTFVEDRQLFAAIAGGDEGAFQIFFHRYNAKLLPFVVSLVRSEIDAREVMQESFLKCWLQRASLHEIVNPGGWIRMVMANTAYDWLRAQSRQEILLRHLPNLPADNDTTDHIDARSTKALIEAAIEQLPERRRQIFMLAKMKGQNRAEIATALGLSENTVRNQLSIAVSFVQAYVEQHGSVYIPAFLIAYTLL